MNYVGVDVHKKYSVLSILIPDNLAAVIPVPSGVSVTRPKSSERFPRGLRGATATPATLATSSNGPVQKRFDAQLMMAQMSN